MSLISLSATGAAARCNGYVSARSHINTQAGPATADVFAFPLLTLHGHRVGFIRVNAKLRYRLVHHPSSNAAFFGQGFKCGQSDVIAINLKKPPQPWPRVRTPEAICTQDFISSGHKLAYLVGEYLHIVRSGHHRAGSVCQAGAHI